MTSILKVDTIQDTDGNNIINESGNTITIGASGDTTNIIGTLQNNGAAVGGTNTPAFEAKMTGVNSSISHATLTSLTVFNSEDLDTDNAFDPSTGKFTPQTAGKYYVECQVHLNASDSSQMNFAYLQIFKNGSGGSSSDKRTIQQEDNRNNPGRGMGLVTSGIFDMNGSSDFVYAGVYINTNNTSAGTISGESNYSWFRGYKLIT